MRHDEAKAARRAAQLGMSHGAAVGRLRKHLLFHFLVRLNENYCFKCGEAIFKADDVSIEHKEPWENKSSELFWNIDNIAFSHITCNRPHSYPGGGHNKVDVEAGMAWCSGCKKAEPVENFWKDASRNNGLQKYCKETKHENR
jgi:hypothetical protein